MATHSSILAWKIPWTEEPVGLRPWDHKKLDTTIHTHTILFLVSNLNNLPQFASKLAHCGSLNGMTPWLSFPLFSRIMWVVFS